jgi:predicted kinase
VTSRPLLIVLAGRPGTGKTSLARRLASELQAAYLRIEAIETAVVRCGLPRPPVGPIGCVVAHEIAAATLALGTPVVVDAVNAVPEARMGWHALAQLVHVLVFETCLGNQDEHRRRVTLRRPDLVEQVVATWDEVTTTDYLPWDDERDGPRQVVDMTDTELGGSVASSAGDTTLTMGRPGAGRGSAWRERLESPATAADSRRRGRPSHEPSAVLVA